MANHEDYLDALTAFARNSSKEIPPILEQYLSGVAKNGETLFQWPLLKPLLVSKMEQVFEELQQGLGSENIMSRPNVENVCFDVMRTRIMDAVHKFTGAPFTVQRLCELLIDPKRQYKRSDKFMRGLEKNVLVVSTVDPFGRKVVSEAGNKHLVNGIDNGSPFFSRDSTISSNLPPVPGWVTTSATAIAGATQEQASAQNSENQTPSLSSNGVGASLENPIFEDQGDQPPAVHAEEVVETAVTVEANEAEQEATGAGEAMAEEEDEEEIGTEDTNASTSSSSSSSSEDLSSSDPGESLTNVSVPPAVTSSSSSLTEISTDARPWASISSEANSMKLMSEQGMELESSESVPNSSKISNSESQSAVSIADCSSPMDTSAATSSHTGPPPADQEGENLVESVTGTDQTITAATKGESNSQGISSSSSSSPVSCANSASVEEVHSAITAVEESHGDVEEQEAACDVGEVYSHRDQLQASDTSTVTSTETSLSSSPSPESVVHGRDVSSSSYRPLLEEDGQPHAKHRRLSSDHEDSSVLSSPVESASMQQDSEPSSSCTVSPPSSSLASQSSLIAAADPESTAVTTSDSFKSSVPSPTATADLDSTSTAVQADVEHPSAGSVVADMTKLGGGDGLTSSSPDQVTLSAGQDVADGEMMGDSVEDFKAAVAADDTLREAVTSGDNLAQPEPMEQA